MGINIDDPARLKGTQIRGGDGNKLGDVEAVYYDNDTNQPAWVSVRSGMFGSHVSIMPLQAANYDGKELRVPFDKEALKSAPHHDPGRELSPQDEEDLFQHYGVADRGQTQTGQTQTGQAQAGQAQAGRTREGRGTDDAMTRSEERLRVGTETHQTGRARLRKRVVTEHQEVQVPVSREEVRVEREPITDANRGAVGSGEISEDAREVTLHEERPVVATEAVPVERVRLGTEKVTGTERVGGDVRHEEIDVEGDERARQRPADGEKRR